MSATGRNLEGRERNENDFYATPAWCTDSILPKLRRPLDVVDAGSGRGAISDRCRLFWPDVPVRGIELNGLEPEDFLAWRGAADLVISNPPYNIAEEFAAHALAHGNEVAFLLRINWLASKKRSAFHRAHPCDLFVLPKRPSFVHGGTDATEYAWFVWGKGRGNRWWLLDVPK